MIRVLFVCTGNICRSPSAEGVLRKMAADAGLAHRIAVESCGIDAWHVGEAPDRRSQAAAAGRGYDLSALRARQLKKSDFDDFDYVLAMDHEHLRRMRGLCPAEKSARVALFLSYWDAAPRKDVPDPYYGDPADFGRALDLIENGCSALLAHIRHGHGM